MSIDIHSKVGKVAAEYPLATRVFARHGIDFCCGGGRPLDEACAEKGLEATAVVEEIRKELETPGADQRKWDEAPLDELIDHILETYHRPLSEELPRLEIMARKVLKVHGEKDPERFSELVSVFTELQDELFSHMAKEEQILFPLVRQGRGRDTGGPVAQMEHEHEFAGNALRRLRELTNDYQVPAEACTTWRALWHGLAALEESMHQHIHLENNILFPRALAGQEEGPSRVK